jgi:hypothetical protein
VAGRAGGSLTVTDECADSALPRLQPLDATASAITNARFKSDASQLSRYPTFDPAGYERVTGRRGE